MTSKWPVALDDFVANRTVSAQDLLGDNRVKHDQIHNDISAALDAVQQIIGLDDPTAPKWNGSRWTGTSLLQNLLDAQTGKFTLLNHIGKSGLTASARQTLATQLAFGTAQNNQFTAQLVISPGTSGIDLAFSDVTGSISWATSSPAKITYDNTAVQVSRPVAPQKSAQPSHAAVVEQLVPIGTVVAYMGTSLPAGWEWCNGDPAPPSLQAIGIMRKPNLQGRFPLGYAPSVPRALGHIDGQERVQLTVNEMPHHAHNTPAGHNHTTAAGNHFHFVPDHSHSLPAWVAIKANVKIKQGTAGPDNTVNDAQGYVANTNGSGALVTGAPATHHNHYETDHVHAIWGQGGDQAHDNMPPYCVVNYIIKVAHL